MNYSNKRRLKLLFWITAIFIFISMFIATAQGYVTNGQFRLLSLINGIVDGFLIGFLLCFYHFYLERYWLKNFFNRRNFLIKLIINSFSYTLLILTGRALGRFITGESPTIQLIATDPWFIQSISIAFCGVLFLGFLHQVAELIGYRQLIRIVIGKYSRPQKEFRFVMFLDLKDSTTIAEEIGDDHYISFLNDFFSDISEPILECRAEIYKYVGDEVILTWSQKDGTKSENCVRIISLVKKQIDRQKSYYLKHYQIIPKFRAGLHYGNMIISELGQIKKEIALIGDLINSTARLLEICKKSGKDFLISRSAVKVIKSDEPDRFISQGLFSIRGRTNQIEVFTYTSN